MDRVSAYNTKRILTSILTSTARNHRIVLAPLGCGCEGKRKARENCPRGAAVHLRQYLPLKREGLATSRSSHTHTEDTTHTHTAVRVTVTRVDARHPSTFVAPLDVGEPCAPLRSGASSRTGDINAPFSFLDPLAIILSFEPEATETSRDLSCSH